MENRIGTNFHKKRKKENVNMHNACRSAKLLFGSVVGKRCAGAALSKHCMELFDSIDSLLDSSNGLTFLTKNSLKNVVDQKF